jgi:hypothetical protein
MLANIARQFWRLLVALVPAGLAVIAGWAEFSLLLRAALCTLMMLLLAVPYFKKNLHMRTQHA